MKLILEIKDDKAPFFLELIKNFSFVKAKEVSSHKEEILENLTEAVEEMKQIKAGKVKSLPLEDFLNEL